MPRLELTGVCVRYGDTVAVDGVSFTLEQSQIGCLVGPSGCGKTSLLRAIAGFEPVTNGSIVLGDAVVSTPCWNLPPHKRSAGMLFQDFALFPHLTVADNIGFGLRGWGRRAIGDRVGELLALVGLEKVAPRYPHEISGGQQQRVALARALAPRPSIVLLDEPFSSQDIDRRTQLAQEVRHILRREHVTALLVTHDQHEAFAMADYIGVMDDGHLHQWSEPYRIYHEPADLFVADFIGHGALLAARVLGPDRLETALGTIHGPVPARFGEDDPVYLLVRPDDILHDHHSDRTATVVNRVFRGADFLYTLGLDDGEQVLCLSPSHHDHPIGTRIGIRAEIEHLVVFPRDVEARWGGDQEERDLAAG